MRQYQANRGGAYANHSEEQRQREIARSTARVYRTRGHLLAQPCELCKTTEEVEMHHTDYSKPLQVHWLCRACHLWLHEANKAKAFRRNAFP